VRSAVPGPAGPEVLAGKVHRQQAREVSAAVALLLGVPVAPSLVASRLGLLAPGPVAASGTPRK